MFTYTRFLYKQHTGATLLHATDLQLRVNCSDFLSVRNQVNTMKTILTIRQFTEDINKELTYEIGYLLWKYVPHYYE